MSIRVDSWLRGVLTKIGSLKVYFLGAFLLYIACFFDSATAVSSALSERLVIGSMLALLLWILIAPFQFLLQLLGHWMIRKFCERGIRRELLWLNLPVILFLAYAAYSGLQNVRSKDDAFKRLVVDEIPSSVSIKKYGYSRGSAGDNYVAFEFQIGKVDLDNLLKRGGFSLVSPQEDLDLATYKGLIKAHSHVDAKLEAPWFHYILRLKGNEKHIFFSTNEPEVVYFWLRPGPEVIGPNLAR